MTRPKATTATFWSSGAPESVTRVYLVCAGPDPLPASLMDALVRRLEALKPSTVRASLAPVALITADGISNKLSLSVEPLPSSCDMLEALTEAVTEQADGSIVVVLPADDCPRLVAGWLGLPSDRADEIVQSAGAVNAVVFHGNRVVLETVNDVCHFKPSL